MTTNDDFGDRIRQLVTEMVDTSPLPDWRRGGDGERDEPDAPQRSMARPSILAAAVALAAAALAVAAIAAWPHGRSDQVETAQDGDTPAEPPATPTSAVVPVPGIEPSTVTDTAGSPLFDWVEGGAGPTAVSELQQLVAEEAAGLDALGATAADRLARLESGGLTVRLTIDPEVTDVTMRAFELLPPELDAAVVTIDNDTGTIVSALSRSGTALGRPQPSTAARLAIYAAALENGLDPTDEIDGLGPCTIAFDETEYTIENFGGAAGFVGTLPEVLMAHSRCALARLEADVGTETAADMLESLAGTARNTVAPQIVEPPTLTAVQQARMVAAIANGGMDTAPGVIAEIVDADGTVLYRREAAATRVMSSETAAHLWDAMGRDVSMGTGTAAQVPGIETAGITGTLPDFTAAWFAGSADGLTTAVWVARPNGEPMENVGIYLSVTGATYPAQLFGVIHRALADPANAVFPTTSTNDPAPVATPGVAAPPPAGTATDAAIVVEPSTVPEPGEYTFTVRGTGWTLPPPVFVVACTSAELSTCDTTTPTPTRPDADGSFEVRVTFDVGAEGLTITAGDAPASVTAHAVVTVGG